MNAKTTDELALVARAVDRLARRVIQIDLGMVLGYFTHVIDWHLEMPLVSETGTAVGSLAPGENAEANLRSEAEALLRPLGKRLASDAAVLRLVTAVQELSLARDLETVMAVVRKAAREMTGADGATFILRQDDQCYYADENAIAPLWKGQRFPMSACISGWVMLNRQCAVIEDIYADPRIPAKAYQPTFVKSLVMVPIRTACPIGAIGNYWARKHQATPEEIEVLQALANTTAVAMENVQVYGELERRVQDRTLQLAAANRELEAFTSSASHDLQAPLRRIRAFIGLLEEEGPGAVNGETTRCLRLISRETERMSNIIDDLLKLARLARVEPVQEKVDLSALARDLADGLQTGSPGRKVDLAIQDGLTAEGHPGLLREALENLLSNAWKYSSKRDRARIEFGSTSLPDGSRAFFVRDDGAGFDMRYVHKLFTAFQRLHSEAQFTGTGVGLVIVQRIIERHGGRIWAEGKVDGGATFFFTLPERGLSARA